MRTEKNIYFLFINNSVVLLSTIYSLCFNAYASMHMLDFQMKGEVPPSSDLRDLCRSRRSEVRNEVWIDLKTSL